MNRILAQSVRFSLYLVLNNCSFYDFVWFFLKMNNETVTEKMNYLYAFIDNYRKQEQ